MTDIVDLDKFHIGKAVHPITANLLGISEDSGYIQFVPAGIRPTIAYPTPIQTAKDFDDLIKSKQFIELSQKYGEEKIFEIIKSETEERGTPVALILKKLQAKKASTNYVEYYHINGKYPDGNPYNGVYAKVKLNDSENKWIFNTISSIHKPKSVTEFIKEFEAENGVSVQIGWNGGYILNAELIGKLGLPESYIGTPLGLIIHNRNLVCPPLFNKAAMMIYPDGKIDIKRANVKNGISIYGKESTIEFGKDIYNKDFLENEQPGYFDLLYPKNEIVSKNRVIVRLAGTNVIDIIYPNNNHFVEVLPVGLTLSFPEKSFPENIIVKDSQLKLSINGLENVLHAIGAGPLLIDEGKIAIDMEKGGWNTENSIKTQAARLDYTDMRGPKIAAGLDDRGNLYIVVINGRIRESVGATHLDMAKVMHELGIVKALGFDPGGSSTLVVDNKVLNISPYNRDYNKNIYSMSPQPRAVSNAVVGYVKKIPPTI